MNDPTSEERSAYHAAVTRFTDAMDRTLARGQAAQARHERLCQAFDFQALLESGNPTPEGRRQIHQRIAELAADVYREHLSPRPASRTTRNTAPRALSSRNRI